MFFANLAKKLCAKSGHHQHHHAVIVVVGGAIKSMGYNHSVKHAEVHALQKMWPSERKKATVYSFRFGNNGHWAMAKPCERCEKYLKNNGVKKVYFTNQSGDLELMKL